MTDFIIGPPPTSEITHRIKSQGLIYDVNYFSENHDGGGGNFIVIGMDHSTDKPVSWMLESLFGNQEHRISLANLEDASDVPKNPNTVPKTSCEFSYL